MPTADCPTVVPPESEHRERLGVEPLQVLHAGAERDTGKQRPPGSVSSGDRAIGERHVHRIAPDDLEPAQRVAREQHGPMRQEPLAETDDFHADVCGAKAVDQSRVGIGRAQPVGRGILGDQPERVRIDVYSARERLRGGVGRTRSRGIVGER